MPYVSIPSEATADGASASALLAFTLAGNDFYLDNLRQAIDTHLGTGSTAHAHFGTASTSRTYTFEDRIRIVSGRNDRLDFYFGGGSFAAGTYAATLTVGTYTLTSLASHLQTRMRAAVGGSPLIVVTYDTTSGSATRGQFRIRNEETTDSPNTRVLRLLFGTGSNLARSVARSIKFRRVDRRAALGYTADGGFIDGYTQDVIGLGDGGPVDSPGLCGSDLSAPYDTPCITTAKMAAGVVDTAALDDEAVTTGKIATGAVTGAKSGEPVYTSHTASAGSSSVTITLPNGGSSRVPCCTVVGSASLSNHDFYMHQLYLGAPSHVSGNQWSVPVENTTGSSINIVVAAY